MILCVGLTPTVQRTQRFATLTPGSVNRARTTQVTASGKAVNVARVVTRLGEEARLIQVVGGQSGAFVASQLDIEGIPNQTIWTEDDAPTRTCTTILPDDGPATELVEEAPPLSAQDVSLVTAASKAALLEARALCCSGSLPRGAPETFYAELVSEAKRLQLKTVVDAQKGPLQAALESGPFLVKPNREEAAATLGLPLSDDPLADARRFAAALVEAGADWALVSLGKNGSVLSNGNQFWKITPPSLQVVNPIGSGDSLAAGFLVAHVARGWSVEEAVVYGTACAAANCLTPTSGVVHAEDVFEIHGKVQAEEI